MPIGRSAPPTLPPRFSKKKTSRSRRRRVRKSHPTTNPERLRRVVIRDGRQHSIERASIPRHLPGIKSPDERGIGVIGHFSRTLRIRRATLVHAARHQPARSALSERRIRELVRALEDFAYLAVIFGLTLRSGERVEADPGQRARCTKHPGNWRQGPVVPRPFRPEPCHVSHGHSGSTWLNQTGIRDTTREKSGRRALRRGAASPHAMRKS